MITDGNKTYAVYTYHCNDIQWSDGSVIGFNAGGQYYTNHPLSDSVFARDIDCVHSPESEWNNVVYDVTPSETVDVTTVPAATSTPPVTTYIRLTTSKPTTPPPTTPPPTTPPPTTPPPEMTTTVPPTTPQLGQMT